MTLIKPVFFVQPLSTWPHHSRSAASPFCLPKTWHTTAAAAITVRHGQWCDDQCEQHQTVLSQPQASSSNQQRQQTTTKCFEGAVPSAQFPTGLVSLKSSLPSVDFYRLPLFNSDAFPGFFRHLNHGLKAQAEKKPSRKSVENSIISQLKIIFFLKKS